MGPIDNVSASVQIMTDTEQSIIHFRNQCWPSLLTHGCVTRSSCVNMINEYDSNIDTKNTTSLYKYGTWLQIIVYTMEMTVIVIIWRHGVSSFVSMAVVCSCVWMGMMLKTNVSSAISSLLAPSHCYHLEKWSLIVCINGCGMSMCLNGDGSKSSSHGLISCTNVDYRTLTSFMAQL